RAAQRHRGVHAEASGVVGGGRDDPTVVGRAADDEARRTSRPVRVHEAGHRDVECVGVGEEDAPVGLTNGLVHRYNDSRPCPTREDTAVLTLTPWVARLLFLNIGVFFLEEAYQSIGTSFALVPAQLGTHPWTILTYMFLHANFSHLLFNMLGLYFFGPRVEMVLGSKRFIALYLTSGFSGALLWLATSVLSPEAKMV